MMKPGTYTRVRKRTRPVQKTQLHNFFTLVQMAEYHANNSRDVRKNLDWFLARRFGLTLAG